MKNLLFILSVLFIFSCNTDINPNKSLAFGLSPAEKEENYSFRAFTGPTMQFGRTGQEILALKFHPDGQIFGDSYQSFAQGESFTDIAKTETRNEITNGQLGSDGQLVFVVNYNENEKATFRGKLNELPLLRAMVSQRAIDGFSKGKTALKTMNDVLYNEIIDGKEVVNPQFVDGFISTANDYAQLRANIHYPQIIQHPKKEVIEGFNLGIKKQINERSMSWFESQSGDEGETFYKKRGELKFESKTFDVAHFNADRLSYVDTISFMNPEMASPRVYLMSYNYDFKQNKALLITDILSDKINHKDFLQKKIIEDLPQNPNKDALNILMSFELEDFQDWTYDGKTLTLYYLPFGEWSYYNVVRAGIPSIAISVAENKAAFK